MTTYSPRVLNKLLARALLKRKLSCEMLICELGLGLLGLEECGRAGEAIVFFAKRIHLIREFGAEYASISRSSGLLVTTGIEPVT